jgi:DNA-binding beta-propeller fold protein YncE
MRPVGEPIEIRGSIDQVAARGDALWVLDRRVGVVSRIDAGSNTVSGSARVGDDPTDMAAGLDAVWVGDRDGSLCRVDPSTLQVTELRIGAEVLGVGVDEAGGSVWVYLGKAVGPEAA